jgi:putative membrane protein
MLIKKGQSPILITIIVMLLAFSIYYFAIRNYEFIMYIFVILFFFVLILYTNNKVNYSNTSLWGLTIWGTLHMAGGGIPVKGDVLYKLILIPVTESIFRYDQFVHIIGFGVATLIMFEILKPKLKQVEQWTAISIVVVMAGLGVGAVNEIVEYIATLLVPETGVGGYDNTLLDLISDLIGALFALLVIRYREKQQMISGKG